MSHRDAALEHLGAPRSQGESLFDVSRRHQVATALRRRQYDQVLLLIERDCHGKALAPLLP